MNGHPGWRSDRDQRRRRHPRTSHPGAAPRADDPAAAGQHRRQAGGDRRTSLPVGVADWSVSVSHDLDAELPIADAVLMLRVQAERMNGGFFRRPASTQCSILWALGAAPSHAARQRGGAASWPDAARHGDRVRGRSGSAEVALEGVSQLRQTNTERITESLSGETIHRAGARCVKTVAPEHLPQYAVPVTRRIRLPHIHSAPSNCHPWGLPDLRPGSKSRSHYLDPLGHGDKMTSPGGPRLSRQSGCHAG
jgi:hypothetical protein